jgi:hypothetical protein
MDQEMARIRAEEERNREKRRKTLRIVFVAVCVIMVLALLALWGFNRFSQVCYLKLEKCWGGKGSTDGRFHELLAVAVDTEGFVWAADHVNSTLQKFDAEGNFLMKITTTLRSGATYNGPTHIGFDKDNVLYARSWSWVGKYTADGMEEAVRLRYRSLGSITGFAVDPRNGDCLLLGIGALGRFRNGEQVCRLDDQSFSNSSVATDMAGNIYVTAFPGIKKFDENGRLVAEAELAGSHYHYLTCGASGDIYLVPQHFLDVIRVFDSNLTLKRVAGIKDKHSFLSTGIPIAVDEKEDRVLIYLAFDSPHADNKVCQYVMNR